MGGSIQASLSGRYAKALFDLARDARSIEAVEGSLSRVRAALDQSPEFARATTSPLLSRADALRVVESVSDLVDLDDLTAKFMGVLAQNRRLAALSGIIRDFRALAAHHRGETTAQVASAHPLSDSQIDALRAQLRARIGRDVAIDLTVDPSLLGGLVVRIGSQMIDSSIKTRLNSLANAMKG